MGSTAITCCDGGDPAVWFTHSQLFASQQPNGGSLCQGCRQRDGGASTAWAACSGSSDGRGKAGAGYLMGNNGARSADSCRKKSHGQGARQEKSLVS